MRSETTQQGARVIDLFMRFAGASEDRVYKATGISAINGKRRGKSPITLDDLDALARFFGVPARIFTGTVPEACMWIAENKWTPDLVGLTPLEAFELRGDGTRCFGSTVEQHSLWEPYEPRPIDLRDVSAKSSEGLPWADPTTHELLDVA